jgi:ATP-binding cassette subfamily B protein
MKIIVFIKYILRRFPFLFISNIVLLLAAGLIEAVSVFSLVVVVDLFINPALQNVSPVTTRIITLIESLGFTATFGWLLTFFLVFNVIKVIFQVFSQYFMFKAKYVILRDMMLGTFEDFFNAKWYFFSSNSQGKLINTFIREISVFGDAFASMARYFSSMLQIGCYLIVPFYLSWQITSISLGVAFIFSIPFFLIGKVSYRLGKINIDSTNKLGSVIQESLTLAKVILGFGNQHKSIDSLGNTFDIHAKTSVKFQTISAAIPLVYLPFGLIVVIIGLFTAKKMSLPLSELVVVFYSLFKVIPFIGSLIQHKNTLNNSLPSYEQLVHLRQSAQELRQSAGAKDFVDFHREIVMERVSFAYPGHDPVLTDVNVCVPKGKMIAIVGASGAGKSTLIDIFIGFNEPISGKITFDGIELKEFNINSYHQHIGYVPQDSILFNMSIKDNLRWAKDNATYEEIRQACLQANAEEFIERFPEKYETVVGDRGVRLSGGQIQRIALARAILRKPRLLILDEATSSLDTRSERLIQQAIANIAKETTIIIIAHRLSTIRNADYIYVFRNGRIIEEGTYLELIKLDGNFSRMVGLQALNPANER